MKLLSSRQRKACVSARSYRCRSALRECLFPQFQVTLCERYRGKQARDERHKRAALRAERFEFLLFAPEILFGDPVQTNHSQSTW